MIKSRVSFFADDTAIYLAISSEGESNTLQNDPHTLELWEKKMEHELQPVQIPGPAYYKNQMSHQGQIYTSSWHGTVLASVPSAKYLGVTISDNLFLFVLFITIFKEVYTSDEQLKLLSMGPQWLSLQEGKPKTRVPKKKHQGL